jgi:HSP20 family protein
MPLGQFIPISAGRQIDRARESDSFNALRQEMDKLFDNLAGSWVMPNVKATNILAPNVNVIETTKGLEIAADLPGIDQKDVDVDLSDGILTIKAERHAEAEEKDERRHYHIFERSHGTFLRRFSLPFDPDVSKVEANLDKGVLRVKVPRKEPAEPAKTKTAITNSLKS